MKILIVGAGFSGAVIAREMAKAGHSVTVIDKRTHIAGNAYDVQNEHGIRFHVYGPHLFHTNNKKVFDYLQEFDEWVPYKHKVKAQLADGRYVTLPVNKETKEIVGEENVLDIFFRPYSRKMWKMELEEMSPDIIKRVPMRDDLNEYYFPNDEFQAMPKNGFTHVIGKILEHENIEVKLNCAFEYHMEMDYDHIFNGMPIDEYYGFKHGELPYRSIKFHHTHIPAPKVLPTTVVNFTHDGKFTRITEWKQIPCHGKNDEMTTLTYEEPCDYKENNDERYYPVKDVNGNTIELFNKYHSIENPKTTFIGRLGLYVYFDMHQCISSSLATADNFLKKLK
jgi:UDP-galactopyranose mutase